MVVGMLGKVLMIQGTTSHAGKSMLVTALCRIFSDMGYKVAPFKAQNMSLNSFVTKDGKEVARSQVVQALASRSEVIAEFNPILLKPKGDATSQIILMGKPYADTKVKEYYTKYVPKFKPYIKSALNYLRENYDIVIIEGAGSPAEINLMDKEIANMFVAKLADAPVILIADIDRGGVFASIYGTIKLLSMEEQNLIKMFVINKFRGDITLLKSGIEDLEKILDLKCSGVIPYLSNLKIPAEDSLSMEKSEGGGFLDIKVINLPKISNFTDFEVLNWEEDIHISYVSLPEQLDNSDVIIIPGTKNTVESLKWMKESGFSDKLKQLNQVGTLIIGVCGGYQILGRKVIDNKIESDSIGEFEGLGLLPIQTEFLDYNKITKQILAEFIGLPFLNSQKINGYEIHMGKTKYEAGAMPLLRIINSDVKSVNSFIGAINKNKNVFGCYIHGLWDNDDFRERFIKHIYRRKGVKRKKKKTIYKSIVEENIQKYANTVLKSINLQEIKKLVNI